jgi:hypothetical protein
MGKRDKFTAFAERLPELPSSVMATAVAPVPLCWAFFVPMRLPSLNDHVQNAGAARWKYKKQREQWCAAVRKAARDAGVAKAIGRRTLTVRRFYKGREQERDYVNLVGGCKVVVDALVLEGLLVDDSPTLLEDRYEQMRVSKEHDSGTWFVLSEALGCKIQGRLQNPEPVAEPGAISDLPLQQTSPRAESSGAEGPLSSDARGEKRAHGASQSDLRGVG